MNRIIEEHESLDGLLRFLVLKDKSGDISLGFDKYSWHTHADILAELSGKSEAVAVRQFVDDLLQDRSIIAIERVGSEIQRVWITDDLELINTSLPKQQWSFVAGVDSELM